MTVSSTVNRVSYAGNGTTTAFSFPYRFFANADLVVVLVDDATDVETTQTLTTHYTVTGAGADAGGTVTMLTAPATGKTLVIYRDPALTQDIDLVNGDPFDVETGVEKGFDKIVLMLQRVKDIATRAMRLSDADTSGASTTLPLPTANRLLGWNSGGTAIENKVPADLSLQTVSSFISTLLDDSTALAARATLGAVGVDLSERAPDLTTLPAETAPDAADVVALGDVSAASTDKVTLAVLAEASRALATAKSGAGGAANYSLGATVASNALTLTLSAADATALSATNKAQFTFRATAAGTGTPTTVDATANLTLTISSGSTLGATSGTPFRLWWAIVNDAGTLRLAVQNCSTSTAIYAIGDDVLISSTAEGGAGAADAAGVWYMGTAVTSKAARIIGYTEHSLTTAGTWNETPDKIQLWQPGMKLPGDTVGLINSVTSSYTSTTTVLPGDTTVPQNTEGTELLTASITPSSSANLLEIIGSVPGSTSGNLALCAAIFRDSTASAIAAAIDTPSAVNNLKRVEARTLVVAASTAATTFKLRYGPAIAGTAYANGISTEDRFGGVLYSSLLVRELMG